MGIKSWFTNLMHKKLVVKDDPTDHRDNLFRMYFEKGSADVLDSIHMYATSHEAKIADYREMLKDGVTMAAVDLIAEDASVIDEETGQCAWIQCVEDPEFAASMTRFLNDNVRINDICYTLAYNIVAFGEVFLSTHYCNEDYKRMFSLGDYFEIVPSGKVVHVYKYGAPFGYLNDKDDLEQEILPEKAYIHFISDRGDIEYLNSEGLYVKEGTSFLEGARSYYKQRQLLDDLLVLARLTRSSFYRLFQVEVGSATSQDTIRMMDEVKRAVNSKQSINVDTNVFSSRNAPILTGGNIYAPTRNGLGAMSVQDVGGEVNVSALKDIEYFDDRYFGALKVPKQFLGQSDEMPGGLGDTTLTQLDVRYARTVKRVQRIISEGIRSLIIWKCLIVGRDIPNFKVVMTHILTAEDEKRSGRVKDDLDKLKSFFELLNDVDPECLETSDKESLVRYISDVIFKNGSLVDYLYKDKTGIEELLGDDDSEENAGKEDEDGNEVEDTEIGSQEDNDTSTEPPESWKQNQ